MERVVVNKAEEAAAMPPAPSRPDNIPEKFWNPEKGAVNTEALLASYQELEKAQGARGSTPPTPAPAKPAEGSKPAEGKPGELGVGEPAKPTEGSKPAEGGLPFTEADMVRWAEEYRDGDGVLSDDTYKELAGKGYPRPLVDTWLAGQKALADQGKASAHALAGGAEQYTEMIQWAVGNLSAAERAAFNAAVKLPGAARDNAINGLVARWRNAEGTPAGRTVGGTSAGSPASGGAFRSTAEMTAAIKDPRYRTDSAYRAEVEARISAMQRTM